MQAKPAGFFRILGAIIYDLIILLFGIFMLVGFIVLPIYNGITGRESIDSDQMFLTTILLVTAFAYYGISWRRAGQTIGMKTWKIYLVDSQKGTLTGPGWPAISIRFVTSGLSALFFFAGFLLILVRPDKRSAHDLISKSHLVHIPKK